MLSEISLIAMLVGSLNKIMLKILNSLLFSNLLKIWQNFRAKVIWFIEILTFWQIFRIKERLFRTGNLIQYLINSKIWNHVQAARKNG